MNWQKLKNSDWWNKWIWNCKPRKRSWNYDEDGDLSDWLDSDYGFLEDIFITIKWKIVHLWQWPGEKIFELKMYHQRGLKGWSKNDAWGAYNHISNVIIGCCEYIRDHKMGFPCECFEGLPCYDDPSKFSDDYDLIAEGRWNKIIDEIIWTFKIYKEVENHDLIIPSKEDEYFTDEELKKQQDWCDKLNKKNSKSKFQHTWKVMSREDFERWKIGKKLFFHYFLSLWD
jgi:hypothetical protein